MFPSHDREGVWLNGELYAPENEITDFNLNNEWLEDGQILFIGGIDVNAAIQPFRGYIADAYLIDGQALEPTEFGVYNNEGVWVPIEYTGTYGNEGYHLDFANPADIGHDSSGNNNDFTAVGFELTDTTDPDYDSMTDSPTQNFATQNSVYMRSGSSWAQPVLSDANLRTTGTTANTDFDEYVPSTIGIHPNDTNTYYFEVTVQDPGGANPANYPEMLIVYGSTATGQKFQLFANGSAFSDGGSLAGGPTFQTADGVVIVTVTSK